MTRDQSLHILQHALGLDDYGQGNAYRNHYVASEDCDGWDLCQAHVAAGRMTMRGPHDLYGGNDSYCFHVTDSGREYVRTNSQKPPKLSRSKQRYQRWLNVNDATGQSFGEWLRSSQ